MGQSLGSLVTSSDYVSVFVEAEETKNNNEQIEEDDNNMEFVIYFNHYTIITSLFYEYFNDLIEDCQKGEYQDHCKIVFKSLKSQQIADEIYVLMHELFNGRILFNPSNKKIKHKIREYYDPQKTADKQLKRYSYTIRDGVENKDYGYITINNHQYYIHHKYNEVYNKILNNSDAFSFEFGMILHECSINVLEKNYINISSSIKVNDDIKEKIILAIDDRLQKDGRSYILPEIFKGAVNAIKYLPKHKKTKKKTYKKARGVINSHINQCTGRFKVGDRYKINEKDIDFMIEQINCGRVDDWYINKHFMVGTIPKVLSPLRMFYRASKLYGWNHNELCKYIGENKLSDKEIVDLCGKHNDAKPRSVKTRVCKSWLTGTCSLSVTECQFAHIIFDYVVPALRRAMQIDIKSTGNEKQRKENAKKKETKLINELKSFPIYDYVTETQLRERKKKNIDFGESKAISEALGNKMEYYSDKIINLIQHFNFMNITPDIYFPHGTRPKFTDTILSFIDSKGYYLGVIKSIYKKLKKKEYEELTGDTGLFVFSLPFMIPPPSINFYHLIGGIAVTNNELTQIMKQNKMKQNKQIIEYLVNDEFDHPLLKSNNRLHKMRAYEEDDYQYDFDYDSYDDEFDDYNLRGDDYDEYNNDYVGGGGHQNRSEQRKHRNENW